MTLYIMWKPQILKRILHISFLLIFISLEEPWKIHSCIYVQKYVLHQCHIAYVSRALMALKVVIENVEEFL